MYGPKTQGSVHGTTAAARLVLALVLMPVFMLVFMPVFMLVLVPHGDTVDLDIAMNGANEAVDEQFSSKSVEGGDVDTAAVANGKGGERSARRVGLLGEGWAEWQASVSGPVAAVTGGGVVVSVVVPAVAVCVGG